MAKTVGLVFKEKPKDKFKCPYCEKEYASKDSLDKHIAEKHSDK